MYSWGAENRLGWVMSHRASDRASWRRVDWAHDALGRRIRQTSYMLSNGVWVVMEDLKFVSDPVWFGRHVVELNATNQTLVSSYVWGLDLSETLDGAGGVGELLWVRLASAPASGTQFVTYDGNGNVWQLVSGSTGTETARYEYAPFGEPLRTTGLAGASNPFRFSAKRSDPATGVVLYEYRAHSPGLGRWLSRDPIGENGGGINLYAFVANDARNHVDVLGLQPCRKLGKISWGFSANIATGIYAGWDASGDLEKCGCCYIANIELGLEVGIGARFRRQRSATVNIPKLGPVGVYFGIDAVFSLAQQRTHAKTTVTWCPGEMSGGGTFYLIDLDLGPNVGLSAFGGGQIGHYVKLNVSAKVSTSIAANAKAGLEIVPTAAKVDVYAIGSATFDFTLSAAFTLAWDIGPWTSPDWLDLGEFNWSLLGGPVGFQEQRLGRILSFP